MIGALKGGLIGGGVGFGIPSAYHMTKGFLTPRDMASAGRFGLVSAIPGAIIGAILAMPDNRDKLHDPKFYLGSPLGKQNLLYRDLIDLYNKKPTVTLTEDEFNQMYQ